MGRKGRERIEKFFSIKRVVNTVEQIYVSRILNRRSKAVMQCKIYLKKIYSTSIYLARQLCNKKEEGVSILFYHSVDLGKPLENFLKQIEYLRGNGYRVISIKELISYVKGEKQLPSRSVCLTFDDGYYNNYERIFPVLQKYNIPATIFLSTKYMTPSNGDEIDLKIGERFLSWGEVRGMANHGIHFGSHGYEHCDLTRLPEKDVLEEILRSKKLIEENLSGKIRYFSYPYGKYDKKTQGLVKRAGFEAAFATIPGIIRPGDNPYALKRTLIAPSDSLFDFKKKIAGVFV
jgi:peptidoglycan/xylan/chitin deacetylase (PgdA/CDA1 family)